MVKHRKHTVRDVATVTVSEAVPGAPRRRGPDKRDRNPVSIVTVLPEVMAAAHAAMRPGERLVIVSETRVDIVNA